MSKSNSKISRNEKIALGILLVAALAFAAMWAYEELQKSNGVSESESFAQEHQTSFYVGETIHLDAGEDAKAIGPDGEPFQACFPWARGAMDVTIDSATLYDGPEDAGISAGQINFKSALKQPFLLLKVSLKNINAQPEFIDDPEVPDETEGLYNIGFLGIPSGELCYFDGTSPKADEKGGYEFELEPGQQKQFTLGFCVQEEDAFNNVLDIGIRPGKYWANFDVDDKREGAEA